ncbi:MAG: fasciclin domain-containing protein [Ilumatobacteraceae bacterium]
MTQRTKLSLAVVAISALVAAGCSDDSSTDDTTEPTVATTVTEPSTTTPATNSPASSNPASSSPASSGPGSTDLGDLAGDVRAALADGDFSTMLDLLDLSGLSDEVEGREITILAPSEDAFRAVPSDELTGLVTDPERAKDLLRRHVLDGVYTYDELSARTEVTTIDGESLPVDSSGDSLTIAGATVSPPPDDALAGEQGQEVAVFEIDAVLLPSA